MKMKWTMLLTIIMLCACAMASAQEYYTLPEIREQAAAGWHETYIDKYDRETTVDIDVQVFGEEVAPVVKVKPSVLEIDGALLEEDTVFTDRTIY